MNRSFAALALAALMAAAPAGAQTAQALFAAAPGPTAHPPTPIGGHSRGCIAGAAQLPETGPTWQAMRLGRDHHWGHPEALAFVERLSREAVRAGWAGLYVGDISQARGGPIPGHASHQIGLDVDIWMLPPRRLDLGRAERESLSSISVKAANQRQVNAAWTPAHHAILEAAARDPKVERLFVTAPVKLQMCADARGRDRAWLGKIRPWWGHDTHFHVRLRCPAGASGCVDPEPIPAGDGCAEAVWWVTEALEPPDPDAPATPPRAPLRLADLPAQCAAVLRAR
jgi:penicillin-insensitive murein endopeptidase